MSVDKANLASRVVDHMYCNDWFSQWLGIEVMKTGAGFCELRMKVKKEMLNGFQIAHGGISYSLADSALAFASNSYGKMAVSIETSISHTLPVYEGDILTAVAEEKSRTAKIGLYEIKVSNQQNKVIAFFKGTVYIKDKAWFADENGK